MTGETTDPVLRRLWRHRWAIFTVLAIGYFFVYFHRISVSVVGQDIVADVGGSIGFLSSVYYWTYTAMQIPSGVMADRFGLFRPDMAEEVPAEWSAAATAGLMLAYLLLRLLCGALVRLPRMDQLSAAAVRRGPWSWFILLTLLMLASVGPLTAAGVGDEAVRIVLYAECSLFFLLSTIRSGQILGSVFSGLSTIW